jgi:hypothetical protein
MRADARRPASAHPRRWLWARVRGGAPREESPACVLVIQPLGEQPPRSLHAVDGIIAKPRFPAN